MKPSRDIRFSPLDLVKQELIELLGAQNCLIDPADKILYGYDHSCLSASADLVTLPDSTEQVQAIIKIANKYNLPIIPRGQATNTCGAVVPLNGGIVITTQRMNKILSIASDDRYAVVQPGVINGVLQEHLKNHSLFWPPDPGSSKICTVGGNIACNAAGPSAVKYGVTRDHVLGLTFVTGSGDIIKTGCHTTKSVVGYDFTRLLIGSQGTLGFITEAVLKLTPLPKFTHTIRVTYQSIDVATVMIAKIMQHDTPPSALELLDANSIKLIQGDRALEIPINSQALLIVEFNGQDYTEVLNQATRVLALISDHSDCLHAVLATEPAERDRIWRVRKSLSPKLKYIAPKKINEDVAVPISKLPELINYINQLAKLHHITIVNFGHAGNGNIHVNLLIDPSILKENEAAKICLELIFNKVIELKGTLSGEHGMGLTKQQYTSLELTAANINLMKQVKAVFDPNNLLNPQLLTNL